MMSSLESTNNYRMIRVNRAPSGTHPSALPPRRALFHTHTPAAHRPGRNPRPAQPPQQSRTCRPWWAS